MFGWTDSPLDSDAAPSLGAQLEDLLVHVLKCEDWARLDDRIDRSLASWKRRQHRQDGDPPH
ncbi:MAG: hypothetical protein J2P45_00310 [Candidatus Dormibacteraeota bacterium]|nr:hypothetical protein [Candidatus Dormibacteraeota bacterium]